MVMVLTRWGHRAGCVIWLTDSYQSFDVTIPCAHVFHLYQAAGFNFCRVFLNYHVWVADPAGFVAKVSKHIHSIYVFFWVTCLANTLTVPAQIQPRFIPKADAALRPFLFALS